jgi:transcription antitermination factor NusG
LGSSQKADVKKMGEACLRQHSSYAPLLPLNKAVSEQPQLGNWYALKVRTGGELSAARALQSRGYDPFCPTQQERRRYSDRMKVVETALFPGYIFCQFDVRRKLPVVSAPGVEYIVGFAGAATPVPELQMDQIRRLTQAGACATGRFERGQRVRVTHGPLEGVEGILVRDPRGDRLVISIDLLNQSASLFIEQDQISVI